MGMVEPTTQNVITGKAWVQPGGFGMLLKVPRWGDARTTVVVCNKSKWNFFCSEFLLMREEKISPVWRIYRWPWRFQRDRAFSHEVYAMLDTLGILNLLQRERANAAFSAGRSYLRAGVFLNWPYRVHVSLLDDLQSALPNVEGLSKVKDTLIRTG